MGKTLTKEQLKKLKKDKAVKDRQVRDTKTIQK